MQTIYLGFDKFPDFAANEADAQTVLAAYRRDGEWIEASHTHALDPIGVLWRDTGATDADGFPVMEPVPGWHCNLQLSDDADTSFLEGYIKHPGTPSRVFAGA